MDEQHTSVLDAVVANGPRHGDGDGDAEWMATEHLMSNESSPRKEGVGTTTASPSSTLHTLGDTHATDGMDDIKNASETEAVPVQVATEADVVKSDMLDGDAAVGTASNRGGDAVDAEPNSILPAAGGLGLTDGNRVASPAHAHDAAAIAVDADPNESVAHVSDPASGGNGATLLAESQDGLLSSTSGDDDNAANDKAHSTSLENPTSKELSSTEGYDGNQNSSAEASGIQTPDDLPMSAYEHALKKDNSLRSAKSLDVPRRPQRSLLEEGEGARRGASSSLAGRMQYPEMTESEAEEVNSLFHEDTDDLAAALAHVDFGADEPDAQEQQQGSASIDSQQEPTSVDSAPPLPPKSPRQTRYALPIGGPGASGPRPELLELLRAPASTYSLRSQASTRTSVDSDAKSPKSPNRSASRLKLMPSSPRRKSSLPKIMTTTAMSKGRARSKSTSSATPEVAPSAHTDNRKGSLGASLTPLVEEDREKQSDSGVSRPESESSMRTANEEPDDGAARDSEDEFKEARSYFGSRFAAPALALFGGSAGSPSRQDGPSRSRRRRGKPMNDVNPISDESEVEEMHSPRSARLSLKPEGKVPKRAASATTLTVDGQVFAIDDETDEYEDMDPDMTPKAPRNRRAIASLNRRSRRNHSTSSRNSNSTRDLPSGNTTTDTGLVAISSDREEIRRPVRAEHEPMIYEEGEMDGIPPPGSYATFPPSKRRLTEASNLILYDELGSIVKFGSLFAERRTLIIFLRHWLCPFCQMFAQSIQAIDPLPLEKAELDMVVVGQGHWHVTKAYKEVMRIPEFVRMYADPSRKIYSALGMTLRTNDLGPACSRPEYQTMGLLKASMKAMKKGIVDMPLRVPGDLKLLGGEFVLGPGPQCSFTHRMVTTRGHLDLPRVLEQNGCDLSLKSQSKQKSKPGSVRSENRAPVRRVARRIARRARPATPRETLATKSSRAAAVAAQQRSVSAQRTSASLYRQYASPLVVGENGDYVVDVGPPRLSGDGISTTNTTPRKSSQVRRQGSGSIRPPVPLSSSASAYAAAYARHRNHSAASETARRPMTAKESSTWAAEEPLPPRDLMPALFAGLPTRQRSASDAPNPQALKRQSVTTVANSKNLETPAFTDDAANANVLQPSAFSSPRKTHQPRTSGSPQSTRPRKPSVVRPGVLDDVRPQARSSSMRGGFPIAQPLFSPGADMVATRSGSSSSQGSSGIPPVPLRYASNAPALPLDKKGYAKARTSSQAGSASGHGHETYDNPLLSSIGGHSSTGHASVDAADWRGQGSESHYQSPLMSATHGTLPDVLSGPTASSVGHGFSRDTVRGTHLEGVDVESGEETEYKRLPHKLLEPSEGNVPGMAQLLAQGANPEDTFSSHDSNMEQKTASVQPNATSSTVSSPLFAAFTKGSPKGRVISLYADEISTPGSQRTSFDASRAEEQHNSDPIPPVPPLPVGIENRRSTFSRRAPQPASVPAFASVLAAEESRKAASSSGHGSQGHIDARSEVPKPENKQPPWYEAVFGSNGANAGSALFGGIQFPAMQGAASSSSSQDSSFASSALMSGVRPTTSSSGTGSFLNDLGAVDNYHSRPARASASSDRQYSLESSSGLPPGSTSSAFASLDSYTNPSSSDDSKSARGPLFASLGSNSRASNHLPRRPQAATASPLFGALPQEPYSSNNSTPKSHASATQRVHSPNASLSSSNTGYRLSAFAEEDEDNNASPRRRNNLALFSAQRV